MCVCMLCVCLDGGVCVIVDVCVCMIYVCVVICVTFKKKGTLILPSQYSHKYILTNGTSIPHIHTHQLHAHTHTSTHTSGVTIGAVVLAVSVIAFVAYKCKRQSGKV